MLRKRTINTLIILSVLLLQVQAFVPTSLHVSLGPWAWPFIDYPMYTDAFFDEPIAIRDVRIRVMTATGKERAVSSREKQAAGSAGPSMFQRQYRGPLINGDHPTAQRLADAINRKSSDDPVTCIRVEMTEYLFDELGLRDTSRQLRMYDVSK